MTDHHARVLELQARTDRHYNCAQTVLMPFAEELGMDHEEAYRLAQQFGAGMRTGSTCGAISGGLMALGLMGATDDDARLFQARFLEEMGARDCDQLLAMAREQGMEKQPYCFAIVQKATRLVEEIGCKAQG